MSGRSAYMIIETCRLKAIFYCLRCNLVFLQHNTFDCSEVMQNLALEHYMEEDLIKVQHTFRCH